MNSDVKRRNVACETVFVWENYTERTIIQSEKFN